LREKGWTAKLGDPAKGFTLSKAASLQSDAATNWLLEEARRYYPGAMARE
jgi:hypothetical protein